MIPFPGGVYHLRRDYLPFKEMEDLSTNLLGASFTLSCMPFRQIGAGRHDWQPLQGKVWPVEEVTYKFLSGPHTTAAWEIAGIHERTIPYPRIFGNKKEYAEWVKRVKAAFPSGQVPVFPDFEQLPLAKDKPGRELEVDAYCMVNHKPNNLNYWHYTCNFSSEENPGKDVKGTKGWRETMYALLAQIFRQEVMLVENDGDYPSWPTWKMDVVTNVSILEWR